jgi:hypothetical protein
MTKIVEHLQFALLMVPTLALLAAAAVSMADLAMPVEPPAEVAAAGTAGYEDQP